VGVLFTMEKVVSRGFAFFFLPLFLLGILVGGFQSLFFFGLLGVLLIF